MRWVVKRVRRREHERGAVAIVTAILMSGFLLGIGAIVTDTGGWFAERAQLQNGADGGALAMALACASSTGCPAQLDATGTTALTNQYANHNANDAASFVDYVCGSSGVPNLTPCTGAQSDGQHCPVPPTNGAKYVNVHTSTLTDSNSHLLPPILGRQILKDPSYAGQTIKSCAQAAWGGAKLTVNLAFTVASCMWNSATNGGTNYAPQPPAVPAAGYERAFVVHLPDDPKDPTCTGAGGSPLPGGFGWTADDGTGNCTVDLTSVGNGWYQSGPGISTSATTGCGGVGRASGVIPCAQNPIVSPVPFPPSGTNACPNPTTPSPLLVPVYDQVCVQPGITGASEVQTITQTKATGGTFTLTFGPSGGTQTTAPIAYNATAATVQTALQGLSTIGAGNASVTLAVTGAAPQTRTYTVAFQGTLALTDVAQITAGGANLLPKTGANKAGITTATTTNGSSSVTGCPAGFSNGKYFHLLTLAALVVTGYNGLVGVDTPMNKNSWLTGRDYCVNPSHGSDPGCLMGYFIKDIVSGDIGPGPDYGVTVVELSG